MSVANESIRTVTRRQSLRSEGFRWTTLGSSECAQPAGRSDRAAHVPSSRRVKTQLEFRVHARAGEIAAEASYAFRANSLNLLRRESAAPGNLGRSICVVVADALTQELRDHGQDDSIGVLAGERHNARALLPGGRSTASTLGMLKRMPPHVRRLLTPRCPWTCHSRSA